MANYNDRGGRRSDDYKRPNRKNSDGFRHSDDRKPRFNDDRMPRFDGDRKPRFDGDRKPRFNDERKPRFNDDRKPRFDGDRKPRFNDDRKPRFDGDRKPRFDGDRKPHFDSDRKPRFDSDRKPRFDGDRKPFESDFFEDEVLDVEFNAFPSPEIVENDEQERDLPSIIMGRNPVKEAIKSGRSIDRILVTKEHDGSLGEIIGLARDENLVIREVDRSKLDEICMPAAITANPETIRASLQKSRVLNMPNSRIYLTMPAFAMKNPLLFFLTALKIRIISAQSSAVRSAPAHTELL